MEGWTLVFTGVKIHEAELIKSLLESNNITSVIINKQDSVYLIGDIEIYVPVEDAFNANQIINNLTSE
jgi:hypothetical protein